jgi:hypothetical protein
VNGEDSNNQQVTLNVKQSDQSVTATYILPAIGLQTVRYVINGNINPAINWDVININGRTKYVTDLPTQFTGAKVNPPTGTYWPFGSTIDPLDNEYAFKLFTPISFSDYWRTTQDISEYVSNQLKPVSGALWSNVIGERHQGRDHIQFDITTSMDFSEGSTLAQIVFKRAPDVIASTREVFIANMNGDISLKCILDKPAGYVRVVCNDPVISGTTIRVGFDLQSGDI